MFKHVSSIGGGIWLSHDVTLLLFFLWWLHRRRTNDRRLPAKLDRKSLANNNNCNNNKMQSPSWRWAFKVKSSLCCVLFLPSDSTNKTFHLTKAVNCVEQINGFSQSTTTIIAIKWIGVSNRFQVLAWLPASLLSGQSRICPSTCA